MFTQNPCKPTDVGRNRVTQRDYRSIQGFFISMRILGVFRFGGYDKGSQGLMERRGPLIISSRTGRGILITGYFQRHGVLLFRETRGMSLKRGLKFLGSFFFFLRGVFNSKGDVHFWSVWLDG